MIANYLSVTKEMATRGMVLLHNGRDGKKSCFLMQWSVACSLFVSDCCVLNHDTLYMLLQLTP